MRVQQLQHEEFKLDVAKTQCCGVTDLHGLYNLDPENPEMVCAQALAVFLDNTTDAQRAILKTRYGYDYFHYVKTMKHCSAHIVFNGLTDSHLGYQCDYQGTDRALEKYILDNKLGSVIKTQPAKNKFITERMVITYVWTPDWDAIQRWWNDHGICRDLPPVGTQPQAQAVV
jgi:hypothetical protein